MAKGKSLKEAGKKGGEVRAHKHSKEMLSKKAQKGLETKKHHRW
jgi:hypothetical protein